MDDHVIYGLDSLPAEARGGVLTIGNFDGVHVGHMRIIALARRLADAGHLPVVAMTFEPPPDLVIRPQDAPQRITPPDQKARLLREAGVDWVVFAATTRQLLSLEADEFIRQVMLAFVAPLHVVEGRNFFFGRERSGNIDTLQAAGRQGDFEVHVVEPVTVQLPDGASRVCSTLIRNIVAAGQVDLAARCLGRPFALYGSVVAGHGRGRSMRYPTANIEPIEQVIPADGIYAGWADVGDTTYVAAISIGSQPTFSPARRTIEAHLLDVDEDFYGRSMALRFVARLRRQRQFDGAESLAAQITKDIDRVREICRQGV